MRFLSKKSLLGFIEFLKGLGFTPNSFDTMDIIKFDDEYLGNLTCWMITTENKIRLTFKRSAKDETILHLELIKE